MLSPHVRTSTAAGLILFLPSILPAQSGQEPVKPPELTRHRLTEPQVAVRFAPDGSRFALSGQQNSGIRQYDRDGKELAALKNAAGGWCIRYSPDGKLIAASGLDRSIRLWDAETGAEVRTLEGHSQTAWEAYFTPDGHTLISIGEDSTIRFWNVSNGKEIGQLAGHPGPVWSMAITADGRLLATGGSDGSIRVWDLTTGRLRRACEGQHNGGVWPLAFSPDGRTLASGGWQDNKVYLWEVATGKKRRQVPHPTGSKSMVFLPDGCTLVTAGNDQTIRFWCLLGGAEKEPLEGHKGAVNALALSPDGQTLISASADNTVRAWSLKGRVTAMKPATLPDRQIEASWLALRRDDGGSAYDAVGALVSAPEQTLKFLADRLQPAAVPDVQKISALIADTGNVRFAVRQKATDELEHLGAEAETHLQRAVAQSASM
ncbi:MAG: WD40 repeat domain-containing protein, partial [Gemmataceae bacterium]